MLTEGRVRAIAAQVALAIAKKIKPSVSEEQIRSDVEAVILAMKEAGELDGGTVTDEQIYAAVLKYLTEHPIESPGAAAGGTIADRSITPAKTTFITEVSAGDPYIERTPDFTPIEKSEGFAWEAGKTLKGSVGAGVTVGDKTNSVLSPYIPVALGKMIRIKGMSHTTANRGAFKIAMYNSEKVAAGMSPVLPAAPRSAGTGCLEAQDPTEFADGIARYKVGYTVNPNTTGYESGVVGSVDFVQGTQTALAYIRICGIPAGAVEDIAISIDEPITYTEQLIVPDTAYELDPDIKVPAAEEALEIAASLQVQAGGESPVEIILNDEDVAVVGQEYNLYHYAVCHGNRPYTDYDIVVTLSYVGADGKTVYQAANNFSECFRFTPDTARDYTLTYRVRAKKPMSYADAADLASKTMTLHVIPNTAVTGKKILIIGDSFTDAGYWVAELQHNLSHGGIVSVGTVSDTVTIGGQSLTVLHEGRSGWATWDYAGTSPSMMNNFNSSRNVFRNADGKFDLGHYFDTYHGGETVDAICIFLGTNGLGADTSTENGMTELINRVREYDAGIPILLHYTIQNVGQDYWSKFAEQHTSTRDYRQHLCRKQYEIYRTKYATLPNVYVVPVYENLDYERDFPKQEVNASARNAEKIYRVTDGHPSKDSGYLKMADTYYAWLLYVLTKA